MTSRETQQCSRAQHYPVLAYQFNAAAAAANSIGSSLGVFTSASAVMWWGSASDPSSSRSHKSTNHRQPTFVPFFAGDAAFRSAQTCDSTRPWLLSVSGVPMSWSWGRRLWRTEGRQQRAPWTAPVLLQLSRTASAILCRSLCRIQSEPHSREPPWLPLQRLEGPAPRCLAKAPDGAGFDPTCPKAKAVSVLHKRFPFISAPSTDWLWWCALALDLPLRRCRLGIGVRPRSFRSHEFKFAPDDAGHAGVALDFNSHVPCSCLLDCACRLMVAHGAVEGAGPSGGRAIHLKGSNPQRRENFADLLPEQRFPWCSACMARTPIALWPKSRSPRTARACTLRKWTMLTIPDYEGSAPHLARSWPRAASRNTIYVRQASPMMDHLTSPP